MFDMKYQFCRGIFLTLSHSFPRIFLKRWRKRQLSGGPENTKSRGEHKLQSPRVVCGRMYLDWLVWSVEAEEKETKRSPVRKRAGERIEKKGAETLEGPRAPIQTGPAEKQIFCCDARIHNINGCPLKVQRTVAIRAHRKWTSISSSYSRWCLSPH